MQAFLEREGDALESLFEQCSCGSWAATAGDEDDNESEDDGDGDAENLNGSADRGTGPATGIALEAKAEVDARKTRAATTAVTSQSWSKAREQRLREVGGGRKDHPLQMQQQRHLHIETGRPSSASGGEPRASFTGTYAHLLAYSLPRTLTKRLVRTAFGDNEELAYYEWCQALGTIASRLYPACKSKVASLQSLIRMVKFATHLCRNAEDFVHALNCVGVLNISFCYWDAYRLHRSYASRGFRGLLQALRSADALEKSIPDDLFEFAQRLLYVDKAKKVRLDAETLEALDANSAALIELYPDLGLGCTFVDFVDRCIADNLLPDLTERLSPSRHPQAANSASTSASASWLSNTSRTPRSSSRLQQLMLSPLRRAFVEGPDAQAWLDRTGVSLPHDQTSIAWAAAQGNFDTFISHVCRELDTHARARSRRSGEQRGLEENRLLSNSNNLNMTVRTMVASGEHGKSLDLETEADCHGHFRPAQSDVENGDQGEVDDDLGGPLLLRKLFLAGCSAFKTGSTNNNNNNNDNVHHHRRTRPSWSRAVWYGFMLRYAAPPVPARRLLQALRAQGPRLEARPFLEAMRFLARDGIDLQLPTSTSGELHANDLAEIPFAHLAVDLDIILCIYCLGDADLQERILDGTSSAIESEEFRQFAAAAHETRKQPLRVTRLRDSFAPLDNAATWIALATALARPFGQLDPSILSVSSMAFMYEQFSPQGADLLTLTDLLALFLSTVPGIDVAKRRQILSGIGLSKLPCDAPDQLEALRDLTTSVASTSATSLETFEQQLEPAPHAAVVAAADADVWTAYERIVVGTASRTAKRCIPGILVCASAWVAERRGSAIADVLARFGAASETGAFEFIFQPGVVRALQSRLHGPAFGKIAPAGTATQRGFRSLLGQVNLAVGVPQDPETRALVQVLRRHEVIDHTFGLVTTKGRMTMPQFEEALARLALHAERGSSCSAQSILEALLGLLSESVGSRA